jgi:hypothetical protein
VVGVLVEVPVMLSLVAFANRTQAWFPKDTPAAQGADKGSDLSPATVDRL